MSHRNDKKLPAQSGETRGFGGNGFVVLHIFSWRSFALHMMAYIRGLRLTHSRLPAGTARTTDLRKLLDPAGSPTSDKRTLRPADRPGAYEPPGPVEIAITLQVHRPRCVEQPGKMPMPRQFEFSRALGGRTVADLSQISGDQRVPAPGDLIPISAPLDVQPGDADRPRHGFMSC